MRCAVEGIRKFFDLPPKERRILAQAWVLFLLAELALRTIPFKHLLTLGQKNCVKGHDQPPFQPTPSAHRLAWLVDVAGRYSLVNPTCLKQALILSWLLRRQGLASTLRIGVARHQETLMAHAWLEQNGQVIIGRAGREQYQPLLRT